MPWPVLLMARALDLGGSERQLAEIARSLDRSEFQPHAGCFQPQGLRAAELAAAGIPIAHFPVDSFASPRALSGTWQLARYIRHHNIRLIHTFDYPMTVFAVPVGRFFTSAVVLSSQRAHRDLIPPRYRRLVRFTDRLADSVVVNCEFVKRHLEHDENVPATRIELCYNGVDLEKFNESPAPRPSALPPDALVIGVVSLLRPEKGLPTLIDAFARVRPRRAGAKLAIVGSGSMLEPLQSQARALGILEDCVFAPATSHVAEWLHAIDIFVLPSLSEALSNSLLEAMACGCCAVASSAGGNPEIVRHQETGWLFQPSDAPALEAALETLIRDEPLRKQLAARGAQSVRDRFSSRASAQRMGEIYRRLIEASRR